MVRAKFRVVSIEKRAEYKTHTIDFVKLQAVYDEGNKSWSKWTPSGHLDMQIDNKEALNQFKLGQTYFLDFTEAPQTEKDE